MRVTGIISVLRLPFLIAIALCVAFGGGIFVTQKALEATAGFGAIRIGPWLAFPDAQTAKADPYARSHRAKAGNLLYGSAEGLVFTATQDQQGEALSGRCDYVLSGQTPPARLWTLYATGAQKVAETLPGALNSRTVLRRTDNDFSIRISAMAKSGNWLAVPENMPFRLTLTLLDTPTAGSSGLIDLAMPAIEKTRCR